MINYLLLFFPLTLLFSCAGSPPPPKSPFIDDKRLKDRIEEMQKPALVMENDEISTYIKQHQLNMQLSGAGLRYLVLKPNPKGKSILTKDLVKMNYSISLLNGQPCYSSKEEGPKSFLVDHDRIESGIHQGIKLLREGEKALFIVPSHLAYGLVGDSKKIPPKAALVYEVEVLEVKSE